MEAKNRRSRAFAARLPSFAAAKCARYAVELFLLLVVLLLSLLHQRNKKKTEKKNFGPFLTLIDGAVKSGIALCEKEKEWKVPSPPGRDACKGRVDANNVEHVCKCTENTFVTEPHSSLEGFTNGLAEDQKPRVSSSKCTDCNKENPTTFVEGEKCRGLLCFKRCLGGKGHRVDKNKRTICTVCTSKYTTIRDQGKGIPQREAYVEEYILVGDNADNEFYNDKFKDAYCARTKTFVEKPRSSERKLHDMYDETSSCCVCARAYVDPAVIAGSYKSLPWTTNENGNDDLSKKLFPKCSGESRFAVARQMISSTVGGIRKAMEKRQMNGDEVQANTCHDCIRKITAVVVGAFEKANEDVNDS